MAKLLLARNDVNTDTPTNDGQTPLRAASYNRHEVAVKLLLAQNDVGLDRQDNHGWLPFQITSIRENAGIVAFIQPPAPPAPPASTH